MTECHENTRLMIDLGAGLKGASQAMAKRGWSVLTVDNNPKFKPDIVADVRYWHYSGPRPLLVWASPPCDEYSRMSMPWTRKRNPPEPDMSVFFGCLRIIRESGTLFWIMENVRGAVPYFRPYIGEPRLIVGAFYLWGFFPDFSADGIKYKKKESYGSIDRERRAMIPDALSLRVAESIEAAGVLL